MALLNHAKKELSAKIVYYGPGLSGKTTNLEWIHRKLAPDKRGKLISLETKTDRTLFFDFLPVQIGEISGFRTRFNVYTVPGQIFYNETRRMVLKGVDGIVFVADSQKEMANENLENLKNLAENLRSIGKELAKVPLVIQFNKRDLKNILSVEEMNRLLNAPGLPFFEAVAVKGEGVLTTLTRVTRVVADHLQQTLFAASGANAPAGRSDPVPRPETRNEPSPAIFESPARPSESDTPAFLGKQPQTAPPSGFPGLQVFSQDKSVTHSFSKSLGEANSSNTPRPSLASFGSPAAQHLPSDDIPSLGDFGEPPESKPDLGSMPTLASVKTTSTREVAPPKETVAPRNSVVQMDRAPASRETATGSYWVDPSLVSIAAEKVSAPESQQGVALRFGEPERESGNQIRIPVALRLETTNELISFQMVIRVEQEQNGAS